VDLLDTLNAEREHVLGIIDGLADENLRRPVLPSGWTILGLVNHLALDDEMFWFRAVMTGQQDVIDGLGGDAWQVGPDVPAASVLDRYRRETELASAIITTADLDASPAWWPADTFGDWRLHTNHQVLLHVITETAVHAGHLDAARELIDHRQWIVLP
jgi:uncharacterized damage-inducible protein DinB